MKLRALTFATLLTLSSLAVTWSAPLALAANGDTLQAPGAIVPGNPCNIVGRAGGIAVDEGANRMYVTSRERPEIYNLSTHSPYTPCSTITPNVAVYGWNTLAYDRIHPTIRFWASNNATVHGLTGAGVSQASLTFGVNVVALELDESTGRLAVLLAGQSTATLYATSPTLTQVGTLPLGYGARALSTWDGGWLVSDPSSYVRLHTPAGAVSALGFRPGTTQIDEFYQSYRTTYTHMETAFDSASYAATGKGALWLLTESASSVCIADCPNPQIECTLWEGSTCLQWTCVASCSGGTWVTTWRPHIRAVEVVAPCPAPTLPWASCGPDPCAGAPWPVIDVIRPTMQTYARNQPVGPSNMPTAAQGPLTIEISDTSGMSGKKLTVSWNGGSQTSTGTPLSFDLDTNSMPRGVHALSILLETLDGCRTVTDTLAIRVEHPTLWTHAQNVRVTGNIPLHLVGGTIPIEPADDLLGRETYSLAERSVGTSHLDALHATASHEVNAWSVSASASTATHTAFTDLDLQHLCWMLVGTPECAAIPQTYLHSNQQGMSSYAHVDLGLHGTGGWGYGYVNDAYAGHKGGTPLGRVSAVTAVGPSGLMQDAVQDIVPIAPIRLHAPSGIQDEFEVRGFKVALYEVAQRDQPGAIEVVATVARITITEGPYRGEIVLGESYAGISLIGRGALTGPPSFAEGNDDYAAGADAPDDPAAANAPNLPPGTYSGLFRGNDRKDAFVVDATPGEKLRLTVQQGHRATAMASPVPTAPTMEAAARLMRLRLYDPLGALRDDSFITLDAHTADVELNVDMAGPWRVLIERTDTRTESAPYSLAITRTPIMLLPDEGALSTCDPAAPLLPIAGVAHGSMGPGTLHDTWRMTRTAARPTVITLSPIADAKGVDFDLRLLDANCNLITTSATHGPTKGAPESITMTLGAGTYFVQAVRHNGVGNYQIAVHAA